MTNVVENAVEHNDTDTPEVDVTVSREDDRVLVRIADDGPGIPDYERRVLEGGGETDLEHSNGLGLWLVRWIVEAAGGSLRIADNRPRGTVVTLAFSPAGPDGGGGAGR